MSDQVHIPVGVLRRAAELLLDYVEEVEGGQVSLKSDYFWSIDPDQLFDVSNEPTALTIGQLTECLDHLDTIIDDPTRGTSYALVWLADLMRAVGQSVVR